MRTSLWAETAIPAATGTATAAGHHHRARQAGTSAYLPAVALAAFAGALVVAVGAAWLLGEGPPGLGRRVETIALLAAAVAASLALASAVSVRRNVVRPLGRLERLATHVVAGVVGEESVAEADATGNGAMATLVDAVQTLAAEVERSRRALQVVQRSTDLTVALDAQGMIIETSPAADSMLGRPAAWMAGKSLAAFVHPDDRAALKELYAGRNGERGVRSYGEARLSHLHGHWVHTDVSVLDLEDGPGVQGQVLNIRDVSDRKADEAALLRRALYDPLTGLANRTLFQEHVDKALARLRRTPARPHAVLFVDLDGFKTVNDSLGHAAGDEVLAEVGRRLLHWMRPGDTAARLGGDEFAVLLENTSLLDTGVLAKRILDMLVAPTVVQGKEVVLTGSIGIALSETGQDSDALLRNADAAMYTAKAAGKGQYRVFEPEMHRAAVRRLDLETDLRRAVGRKELYLSYQPIVDLATDEVTSAEVLARWKHPERGLIPPLDFISVAEDSGYIRELGRHILEQACQKVRQWHRMFPERLLHVCVNTSVRQLEQPEFFDEVASALADSGLDGSFLTLEITESLFMSDFSATVQKMRRLKELGLTLAVDDFGTGYSSLSYLRSLPIDVLKIDKSFVVGVTLGPEQSAVARAVVKLARTFNLRTVAEGIEQPEQAAELLAMGADMGQGYWYARPLPPEDMEAFLGSHRTPLQLPPFPAAPAGRAGQ